MSNEQMNCACESSDSVLKKQLSAIGMCMRARKLLLGPDTVCDAMRAYSFKKRGERVYVVIEASDTSDNTHKKITDKCVCQLRLRYQCLVREFFQDGRDPR